MHFHRGFADINGAQLAYEVAGSGPALILLHGHLLDSGQWDDQLPFFATRYRTVRYDARGFGQSTLPPTAFAYHDDLHALLRFLAIERAVLLGCSGGGATIIDFALRYPHMVNALIVVGTGLSGYRPTGPIPPQLRAMDAARQRGAVAEAVERSLEALTDGPRRRPDQVSRLARERTGQMTARLFARPQVPEAMPRLLEPPAITRLAELSRPMLVVVGDEDQAPIHEIATLISEQCPQAERVIIPDAGHHPNMEHPDMFNQLVVSFVEKHT